jgi:predicted small lipoprotein YifL
MLFRTLIVVFAVAALAGCGRRGDLEPPGGKHAVGAVEPPPTNVSPLDPGSTVVPAQAPASGEPAPRKYFILDFLL